MTCDDCLGLLIISIVCFIITIYLLKKYLDESNKFTLYMVFFFFLAGLGWILWFLAKDWVFNIYDDVREILYLIGVIPLIVLLYFVLTFLEVSIYIRILTSAIAIVVTITGSLLPEIHIKGLISVVIISVNIVLFIINWRKNNDIKSLGFSIGLAFVFLGESFNFIIPLLHGIFLIVAAIIWVFTYSGLLEKILGK